MKLPAVFPSNGSWWVMVLLSALCSGFMIGAISGNDNRKLWRGLTLLGSMLSLVLSIGAVLSPDGFLSRVMMPQCKVPDAIHGSDSHEGAEETK
jgi:Na+/pantothenate symporter